MLQLSNEFTALVAVPLLLLVARGFWPSFWRILHSRDWHDPRALMVAMILLADARSLLRMSYWDLYRPLVFWLDSGQLHAQPLSSALVNAALNLTAVLAALLGLRVLLLSIPEDERPAWSMLTAPFYPRRIRFTCTRTPR